MKKVLLVLGLLAVIFVSSCTPDDQCGTVTGWDIDYDGSYLVYIDGDQHTVNVSTWYEANTGNYMCISY